MRKTADPISSTELEGASLRPEDDLLRPAHDLQEPRVGSASDGWLRQGVFEGAPTAVAEVVPRARRDASSRKRAVQKPATPPDVLSLEDLIRNLAYELFEERGREHGHDVEDWLRAEELIMAGQQHRGAAA